MWSGDDFRPDRLWLMDEYGDVNRLEREPAIVNLRISFFHRRLPDVGSLLQRHQRILLLCLTAEGAAGPLEGYYPHMESLLYYVRGSNVMRALELEVVVAQDVDGRLNRMVRRVLQVAAENSNIDTLIVNSVYIISRNDVCAFLERKSQMLKHFNLDLHSFCHSDDESSKRALAKAIGAITVLHSLEVTSGSDIQEFSCILQDLHMHSNLRNLSIKEGTGSSSNSTGVIVESVSTLIAANPCLEALEWKKIYFTKEVMTAFVESLKSNENLQKISFKCRVHKEAARVFQQFLRSSCNRRSSLRELVFGSEFGGMTDKALLRMLSGLGYKDENGKRVSSSIQRLRLDFCGCFDEFFRRVLKYSKLSHLHIGRSMGCLLMCLPRCLYLRKLVFDSVRYWNRQFFFSAIHHNGSLHHVNVKSIDEEWDFLSEKDLRWMNAIGERNRLVPQLVRQPRRVQSDETSSTIETAAAQESPSTSTTDLAMFPPLFEVAMPAFYTAPNTVLSGLLALSVSSSIGFGLLFDKKRSSSSS